MNIFLIIVMLMFAWLAFIWNSADWVNATLKFVFILMCGWSIFLTFQHYGFLIKV